MHEDMSCVFEGIDGKGAIFISGVQAARNLKNEIGAVLTAAREAYISYPPHSVSHVLYVAADDHPNYDLKAHFDRTFDFINEARRTTNVLVHCVAGISRSATIVIAYLLRKYSYSLDATLTLVKRRRDKINPNPGFMRQIQEFNSLLPPPSEAKTPRPTSAHHRDTDSLTSYKSRQSVRKPSTTRHQRTLSLRDTILFNKTNTQFKQENIFSILNTENTPIYSKGKIIRFPKIVEKEEMNKLISNKITKISE